MQSLLKNQKYGSGVTLLCFFRFLNKFDVIQYSIEPKQTPKSSLKCGKIYVLIIGVDTRPISSELDMENFI